MKRTGEKVLIIIAMVFNLIGISLSALLLIGFKAIVNDPSFADSFVQSYNESLAGTAEAESASLSVAELNEAIDLFGPFLGTVGWVLIAFLVISLILGIVAFVYISKGKKTNTSGSLLIVAGLLAGVVSLTSILYYIAAVMCFVRKPKQVTLDVE